MAARYDVYLSSTLDDLREERKAVIDALGGEGIGVKQSYGASERDLIATCLDDVRSCRVYIGIVGLRYGHCPPDGGGRSITELEFDQAVRANLPCQVFIKDEQAPHYAAGFIDADRHAIDAFRARLQSGQQLVPARFASAQDLKEKLLARIGRFRRLIDGVEPLMQARHRNAAELVSDIGLLFVPGTDDTVQQQFAAACGDQRFALLSVSPDETEYVGRVDAATHGCRAICWVLSPRSIARFATAGDKLARAVAIHRQRYGHVFGWLVDGASIAQLDAKWEFTHVIDSAAGGDIASAIEAAYRDVRERVPQIRPDRRIGIPYVPLALTDAEARDLLLDEAAFLARFEAFGDTPIVAPQLAALRAGIRTRFPDWPAGFYGPRRGDWRPFGAKRPTIDELLQRAIDRINDADRRSGRERMLLAGEDLKLQPRRYEIDEYLDDAYGSHANLDRIRDLGCLVLVDESALLHPRIRDSADRLLSGDRVAVMSANPFDPAPMTLERMLGGASILRVGTMRERFRDALDPRCELAVNSLERLERWLRLVLPELVPALGHLEPQAALRDRAEELLR